jgi:hypothetical protein
MKFRKRMKFRAANFRRHFRHSLGTSLLLAMLLMRAYVPVGFMPASGNPFRLELCPAAYAMPMPMSMPMDTAMSMPMPAPMSMPGHHHQQHSTSPTATGECPFGSVPGGGPISQPIVFQPPGRIDTTLPFVLEPLRLGVKPQRAHQSRAPPVVA